MIYIWMMNFIWPLWIFFDVGKENILLKWIIFFFFLTWSAIHMTWMSREVVKTQSWKRNKWVFRQSSWLEIKLGNQLLYFALIITYPLLSMLFLLLVVISKYKNSKASQVSQYSITVFPHLSNFICLVSCIWKNKVIWVDLSYLLYK